MSLSCNSNTIPAARADETRIHSLILFLMVAVFPLIFTSGKTGFTMPKYIFLSIISIVALFLIVRMRIKLNHPAYIPLLFFVLFAFISTFLAAEPLTAWIGLYRFTGLSTYLFCAILLIFASASRKPVTVLLYMIACAVLVSLIAVLQYFGVNIITEKSFIRAHSVYATIGHPNFLATYTIFILPAAILLYIHKNKLHLIMAAAIIYAGLLVSLTRGSWLAFIPVTLVLIYYCSIKRRIKQLAKVYIVFGLVTCSLLPVHDWFIVNRAQTVPDEVSSAVRLEDRGGYGRVHIWKETALLIRQNWAFGVGPDSFMLRRSPSIYDDKAHNIYLEILVTMGVFALISYLLFLSFFLRPGKDPLGFIFFVMIVSYLVQGLFNIDVVGVMPLFWIILGLALGNFRNEDIGHHKCLSIE